MGMFFKGGSSNGSWWTRCEQDSRFDMGGSASGMFGASDAIDEAIRAKAKQLGLSDKELDKLKIETGFCKD